MKVRLGYILYLSERNPAYIFFDERRRIRLDEKAHVCEDIVAELLLYLVVLGDAVSAHRKWRGVASSEKSAGGDAVWVEVDQARHRIDTPSIQKLFERIAQSVVSAYQSCPMAIT